MRPSASQASPPGPPPGTFRRPGAATAVAVPERPPGQARWRADRAPNPGITSRPGERPGKILADPETQLLIDFTQPVALLLVAVLHFIPDTADPAGILATLREALVPGSYLVICHSCRDARPDLADPAETVYSSRVAGQLCLRTRDQIARLFDGFSLVEPGLVWIPQWRPDSPADVPGDPQRYWGLVGVGRREAG